MNATPPTQAAPFERVLVVEDEPDLQRLVVFNLRDAGFAVEGVGTGAEAFAAIARTKPAVIVLDLMLPDITGTEICRRLRADALYRDIGIVISTARGDEYDRLLGFEVGADDYVVKPFSVRELVMRVRALVRRPAPRSGFTPIVAPPDAPLRWRGIDLDPLRHRASIDGEAVILRPLEFKLLHVFMQQPGCVLTRAALLEGVWGVTEDQSTRTVDTHVRRLRERIAPYSDAIETVHGFGYKLREIEEAPTTPRVDSD
jgi:two-component system phosphate regulon response regulator PhoB